MDNCENYVLSIQVRLDGFSFDIVDPITCNHLLFKDIYIKPSEDGYYIDSLIELMEQEPLFHKAFRRQNITFSSPQYTLIPLEYYSKGIEMDCFETNFKLNERDCLISYSLLDLGARMIFSIPKRIFEYLTQCYASGMDIKHPLDTIIRRSLIHWSNGLIHLHLNASHFDLVVSSQQQLSFINTFDYLTIEDIMYYVSSITSQLAIRREECQIVLSGYGTVHEELIMHLKPFFMQVGLIDNPTDHCFDTSYENVSLYKYYPLFS